MKSSFHAQQIFGTLAIITAWFSAIVILNGHAEPDTVSSIQRLAVSMSEPKPTVLHEPRDPKSGETARHHFKNAQGTETQTVVDFVDKGNAVVEYSVFGKPSKVTETRKDGSSLVFHLDPMQMRLLKIESKRKDGTLLYVLQPSADGSLERTFFSASGSTSTCRQKLGANGKLESEIFAEDGNTVLARYKQDEATAKNPIFQGEPQAPRSVGILETFDKNGKLIREEKISRQNEYGGECCEGEGEYEQELVSVKLFGPNGVLQVEQEWIAYPGGDPTLQSAVEYQADGSTKLRSVTSCYENIGKESASQRVENFDKAGKLSTVQLLDSSGRVIKVISGDKTEEIISNPKDRKTIAMPLNAQPQYKQLPQEFLSNQLEAHRLQQVLSN